MPSSPLKALLFTNSRFLERENYNPRHFLNKVKNISEKIFVIFLLAIVFFFAAYKLTESPPTWFDEGILIQSAVNLVENGTMGIQLAPDFINHNATTFSTGFPLAYPVGWAMKFFGKGLLPARSIMVVFSLLLVLFFYLLSKRLWGFITAAFSSFLLVSFAPFYGNGKNVLGEVPGLFFRFLFLYFVYRIESESYGGGYLNYIMAGLAAGLCISTKSIFLVLPAAVILGVIILRRKINWHWYFIFVALVAFIAVMAIWIKTQFLMGGPLMSVFQDYANPYAVSDTFLLVWQNLKRFFSEAAPAYLLAMTLVWATAIIIRKIKKEETSLVELISFFFALFIGLSFLRMVGWYRYLFPAQVIALIFLPASTAIVFDFFNSQLKRKLPAATPFFLTAILISFQFYQLCFGSWVSGYYGSHNARDLKGYFAGINPSEKIFLYDTPEIATFLPSSNYYQYLKINDNLIIGQEELAKVKSGLPDKIIINAKKKDIISEFSLYSERTKVSKYLILEKN